jgi:hypothetical protein
MGNIPAKITGKYQSYDINTPTHMTPPMTLKRPSTSNSIYDERSNNTMSKANHQQQQKQQTSFSENNRYNTNNHTNGHSRNEKEFNRHLDDDDDDNDSQADDDNHHKAWREQINQRNSKHDSFNEEIFNSSQQKLEESIYTENPTIRDSRIIEGSFDELSPNFSKSRRNHAIDDDDDDEGI